MEALEQLFKAGVDDLAEGFAADAIEKASGDGLPFFDERAHAAGVEDEVEEVAWFGVGFEIDEGAEEARCGLIGAEDVPVAVEDERGVRFVLLEHAVDGAGDDG